MRHSVVPPLHEPSPLTVRAITEEEQLPLGGRAAPVVAAVAVAPPIPREPLGPQRLTDREPTLAPGEDRRTLLGIRLDLRRFGRVDETEGERHRMRDARCAMRV